jgi:hypothetical protein
MKLDFLEIRWTEDGEPRQLIFGGDDLPPAGTVSPRPGPARRGRPWSEEEEGALRDGFGRGESPEALAKGTGRTAGAVRARLVKLGLLDAAEAGLRYPLTGRAGA